MTGRKKGNHTNEKINYQFIFYEQRNTYHKAQFLPFSTTNVKVVIIIINSSRSSSSSSSGSGSSIILFYFLFEKLEIYNCLQCFYLIFKTIINMRYSMLPHLYPVNTTTDSRHRIKIVDTEERQSRNSNTNRSTISNTNRSSNSSSNTFSIILSYLFFQPLFKLIMSNKPHLSEFYNVYKDSRNKWGFPINKLNLNIDNYKTPIVIILTCQGIYAYTNDISSLLKKSGKFFFILSVWCFLKLLLYVIITILSFAFISNEKMNSSLYYYGSRSIYFNYFMEIIITINIVKSVLTLFTGTKVSKRQKVQYIFSCIRTCTILKTKIRKDLEKQSFLFDYDSYGTFMTDFQSVKNYV
ncbi:hypothetical protein MKS88_002261 [Plasmodium brasilianum]|uniref:Uncharacterized protein n=1 Tax=Plasmodium brasilianum TaxID=5824 RepID=A0ACB9YBK1_PLABR|nr:hypothetical protein MKS88_002261 [Plasmodium brasilianum]